MTIDPVESSIIIRTKNEEKWIGELLDRLAMQSYKNFEIVIVDSGSTDRTLKIVNEFRNAQADISLHIFHIKPEEFSYPFALNVGCCNARATTYFVIMSAHSVPVSETWIADGLSNFTQEKILGVYGPIQALPDGTLWEKIFFNKFIVMIARWRGKKEAVNRVGMGVLGFTNAIVRRDLWERYRFDERWAGGGEDTAWAAYWFARGYGAIKDARFAVSHSHGLGIRGLIAQWKHWKNSSAPQPFHKPTYRK